ncbi:hypothetical protein A6R74_17100 [Halomonas sp. ALS9]|nr:hypothetical protein A6R74_17100 [Halomonas sp. ALS9]
MVIGAGVETALGHLVQGIGSSPGRGSQTVSVAVCRVMKGLERDKLLFKSKKPSSTSFSWALKWLNADIKITHPDDRRGK